MQMINQCTLVQSQFWFHVAFKHVNMLTSFQQRFTDITSQP